MVCSETKLVIVRETDRLISAADSSTLIARDSLNHRCFVGQTTGCAVV